MTFLSIVGLAVLSLMGLCTAHILLWPLHRAFWDITAHFRTILRLRGEGWPTVLRNLHLFPKWVVIEWWRGLTDSWHGNSTSRSSSEARYVYPTHYLDIGELTVYDQDESDD